MTQKENYATALKDIDNLGKIFFGGLFLTYSLLLSPIIIAPYATQKYYDWKYGTSKQERVIAERASALELKSKLQIQKSDKF